MIEFLVSMLLSAGLALPTGSFEINRIHEFNLECGHSTKCGYPFTELTETLNNAKRGDIIRIYNGDGGSIDMRLIRALENTKAHIVTINRVGSFSMGTNVLMRGDTIILYKNEVVMQHSAWRKSGWRIKKLRSITIRLVSPYKSIYTTREYRKVIGTIRGVRLKGSVICKRMKHKIVFENDKLCKFKGFR